MTDLQRKGFLQMVLLSRLMYAQTDVRTDVTQGQIPVPCCEQSSCDSYSRGPLRNKVRIYLNTCWHSQWTLRMGQKNKNLANKKIQTKTDRQKDNKQEMEPQFACGRKPLVREVSWLPVAYTAFYYRRKGNRH